MQEKEKIGIFTFEQFHGKKDIGSSRIRGTNLVKYWDEAEIFKYGQKYDAIIFQKVYFDEYLELYDGIKILDICDPDWTISDIMETVNKVDAVTCPTNEIANFFRNVTDKKVKVISDRHDLELYRECKIHKGRAKEVVWHGYSHNSHVLKSAIYALERFNLNLSIISDNLVTILNKESKCNERFTKWNLEKFGEEMIKSDICIMPSSMRPNDRFKSDNKTTLAWSLGLPVATNVDELSLYLNEEQRIRESVKRLDEVRKNYDVRKSVEEYKELIEEIKKEKK